MHKLDLERGEKIGDKKSKDDGVNIWRKTRD